MFQAGGSGTWIGGDYCITVLKTIIICTALSQQSIVIFFTAAHHIAVKFRLFLYYTGNNVCDALPSFVIHR